MKIITRLVFLAGFLLVTTVAGSEFNLDSLLVKSVGGPGAADIISNMTTYKTTGTVSLNGQPGSFVEYFAPPNRSYLKIDLMGFIMVQAYDGETAWQMDQNGQALELDGFEKREIQKGLYFNSFAYLFPNRVPGGRAYLGTTVRDGREYHRVAFYPFFLDTIETLFDIETGRRHLTLGRLDELETSTVDSDFRMIDGVLWPFHSHMETIGAPLAMAMVYDSVIINADFDPSIFEMPGKDRSDFHFPAGAKQVSIPFAFEAGHIKLPVIINGTTKVWLILDSGASANIFNVPAIESLELEEAGTLPAKGIGAYEEVKMVRTDSVSIGSLTLYDQIAGTLDMDYISGPGPDGRPFGGVLGFDFLSRFPILVNYADSTLTVYNPDDFVAPDSGSEIEFTYTMKIPTVRGELLGIPGDFVVDLGNAFGLVVHQRFAQEHNLLEKLSDVRDNPTSIGGVGGSIGGKNAFAASFKIGEVLMQSIRVLLPESSAGLAGSQELAGNIGNRMLANFKVLFDYAGGRIILYPAD